jgi:hypothetical protein
MVDQNIMVLTMDLVKDSGKVENLANSVHLWQAEEIMCHSVVKVLELMVDLHNKQAPLQRNHNLLELIIKTSLFLIKLLLKKICKTLWKVLSKPIPEIRTYKISSMASSNT